MTSGQELPKSVPSSCRLAGRFRTQALRIFVLGDAAGIEAQGHQGHRATRVTGAMAHGSHVRQLSPGLESQSSTVGVGPTVLVHSQVTEAKESCPITTVT